MSTSIFFILGIINCENENNFNVVYLDKVRVLVGCWVLIPLSNKTGMVKIYTLLGVRDGGSCLDAYKVELLSFECDPNELQLMHGNSFLLY